MWQRLEYLAKSKKMKKVFQPNVARKKNGEIKVKIGESAEMYLETILILSKQGDVRAIDIV